VGLTPIALDGVDQWLEFVRAAPGDAGDETFIRKTFGDGATRGITCADNQYDLLVIHGWSPLLNDR
jgi:hypothetical protein